MAMTPAENISMIEDEFTLAWLSCIPDDRLDGFLHHVRGMSGMIQEQCAREEQA